MFLYFCLWLFKSLSQMAFYFSNLILQTANLKSGLRFLNRSKIIVRILLLENQELIVNSQPPIFGGTRQVRRRL